MNYRLFLDDRRHPRECVDYMKNTIYNEKWIVAKDYDDFVEIVIQKGIPSIVSYDHDLADEHYTPEKYWDDYEKSKAYQDEQKYREKTGLDCAKWMKEHCRFNGADHPPFLVHSMNPVGADNKRVIYMVNKVDWFIKSTFDHSDFRGIKFPGGKYNGYIVVSKNNPYFGKGYDDVDVSVHGGFTFSQSAESMIDWPELPGEYANANHWVFGWDTRHYGDTEEKWPKEKVEMETARAAMDMQVAEIRQEREKNRKRSGEI